MKIRYSFVNETIGIEVEEMWGNVLLDLDRQEYNNDQRETRRHASLHALNLDDGLLPSDADTEAEIITKESSKALQEAISKLKPKQQLLIRAIFFEGITVNEYAAREGVDHSAISHRLETAKRNIKKFYRNPHI